MTSLPGNCDDVVATALADLVGAAALVTGTSSGQLRLLEGAAAGGADVAARPPHGWAEPLCDQVVSTGRVVVVPDLRRDARVVGRQATAPPDLRFYAGAPLRDRAGRVLGTLYVVDAEPRELDDRQVALLEVLADQVVALLVLLEDAATQRQAVLEMRMASTALAASESRYRMLAHHATDIVSRHAPDGTVLYVSPSLRTVLGADPDAETGTLAPDRVHPDDRAQLDGALLEVVSGGPARTVTHRAAHADGTWRWLETTMQGWFEDGVLVEVQSASRDVTARTEAAAALAETEQRYRALVEQSPDAILVHVDGIIVFANSAAAELLRAASPQELIGVSALVLVDPAGAQVARERVARVLTGESVPALRQRVRRLDGTWVSVDASGSPVQLDGRLAVQDVVRDATPDEAAAQAVLLNEQQHRTLFERSPVGMVECDATGTLLRANEAFGRLLGRPVAALVGGRMRDLATAPPGEPRIAERLAAGEEDPTCERTFVRDDGTHVQATLSTAVLSRDDTAGTLTTVVTVVDMTERNIARAELELLVRELGEARDEAQRRTALLDAVLDTIDVGVVACDAHGNLTLFNRATRDFHGLPAQPGLDPAQWADHYDLRNEDGTAQLDPDQVPLYRALVDGAVHDAHLTIATPGRPARVVRCDGRALRASDGRLTGAVVAMKDVTDLRASEQRFRAAFQNGPTPMARLDADGTVREANPALRRFLSVPTTRLLGRFLSDFVLAEDGAALTGAMRGTGTSPAELRIIRSDGTPVWCELSTTTAVGPGGTPYVLAQLLDVDARKTNELALERAARQDPLTGLGNRSALELALADMLDPSAGTGACVLFIDLDDFKAVNDTLGHDIGDQVLATTAGRLTAVLRAGDTATRTGGDEFVVACPLPRSPSEHQAAAAMLRSRVSRALSGTPEAGAPPLVGASIGVALGLPGEDPTAVIARADQAMYDDKATRRRTRTGAGDGGTAPAGRRCADVEESAAR